MGCTALNEKSWDGDLAATHTAQRVRARVNGLFLLGGGCSGSHFCSMGSPIATSVLSVRLALRENVVHVVVPRLRISGIGIRTFEIIKKLE